MSDVITVWRIGTDTPDYEAHELSGKGAEDTGGRWNRKGTPAVYASASRALACLETIVHLGGTDPLPLNRYLVRINIPIDIWNARAIFDPGSNVGWDAEPAGRASMDWGTNWLKAATGLLAELPSVIVPEERNFLLNPAHPDVRRLTATKVRRWTYDQRIK